MSAARRSGLVVACLSSLVWSLCGCGAGSVTSSSPSGQPSTTAAPTPGGVSSSDEASSGSSSSPRPSRSGSSRSGSSPSGSSPSGSSPSGSSPSASSPSASSSSRGPSPRSSSSSAPRPNPNPPPGTTSYDIPQVGADLHQQQQWEEQLANRCDDAGFERDCLTFAYQVYRKQEDGSLTAVANPGPDYDDQDGTYSCTVRSLVPAPGRRVAVGTVIRVRIVCAADDSGGSSPDDSPVTTTQGSGSGNPPGSGGSGS
jgi:hypothetical protein